MTAGGRERELTVLLCSAGRRPYLPRWFRAALDTVGVRGRILVADADPTAAARGAADEFVAAPRLDDDAYLPWLRATLDDERVDLALSVNDFELSAWSALERAPAALVALPRRAQSLAEDKWALALEARTLGLPVPWTALGLDLLDGRDDLGASRYVVKSRFGSGSVGLRFATAAEVPGAVADAAREVLDRRGRPVVDARIGASLVIVQQLVQGTEFGVDVIADLDARFAAVLARRKLGMRAGETDSAETVTPDPFRESAVRLHAALRHRGPIDCDFMVDRHGDPWLIDVNPRFGGGYPFSHVAGADVPSALVAWAVGAPVHPDWLRSDPGITASKAVGIERVTPLTASAAVRRSAAP